MKGLGLVEQYFNFLNSEQLSRLGEFLDYLREWNGQINLVARTDIEHLVEHHLLPSLAIAKICRFAPGSKVLDVGTGGGFPGIPLAICFPEVDFLLVDSIGKKVKVVNAMIESLELKNVQGRQVRAEDLKEEFDFVVGRAVAALPKFIGWVKGRVKPGEKSTLPNGILYLKGGDITEEVASSGIAPTGVYLLSEIFLGEYCQDKCLIYFDRDSVLI